MARKGKRPAPTQDLSRQQLMEMYGYWTIIHLSEDGSKSKISYHLRYDPRTVNLKQEITEDDNYDYDFTVRQQEVDHLSEESNVETLSDHAPLADFLLHHLRKNPKRPRKKRHSLDYDPEDMNAEKLKKAPTTVEKENKTATVSEDERHAPTKTCENSNVGNLPEKQDASDGCQEVRYSEINVPRKPRSCRARTTGETEDNVTTAPMKGLGCTDVCNSLIMMHCEARKELIRGWKEFSDELYAIGIKQIGELDLNLFKAACRRKDQTEEEALQLHSFWQSKLGDPNWYPFQVVQKEGKIAKEIINENDTDLKELKLCFGCEVHDAVCRSLVEMNEYNPSGRYGRYPVEELWNYKENRRATLKEAISVLLKIKRD